ncbi:MAG: cupin domain-containing protein [Chloroflexi bacterium]|nr:cupin domain-containing protein [Chloroflexota bacterium]
MVETVYERNREPEPKETSYDRQWRLQVQAIRRRVEGRVVIRGQGKEWEQSRQGFSKQLCSQDDWGTVGAPGWHIFVQKIRKHSGRHTHQGGLGLFVLDGKGYSVVDGVRYDWEEGDLILLPVKPGGCEHQHFNLHPEKPAVWMAWRFWPMRDPVEVYKTQQEEHPDWTGGKVTSPG